MPDSGRTAFVTGGARGIGRAIAIKLAAEGHAVAIGDLRADQANETAAEIVAGGGRAIGLNLDVTDKAATESAITAAIDELGAISILVNNAGWDDLMRFTETDEPFWDKVIEINYKGVLRTTAAILPGMLEREWGRIVNIGSDAGRVGSSWEAVYAGAKGAVIAFTKTIARETARKGVTANVVCPGPTDTPLLEEIVGDGEDPAKVIARMTSGLPMKRLGKPEEVAAGVAFMASEGAGFVTGQTLSVSGGLTMS